MRGVLRWPNRVGGVLLGHLALNLASSRPEGVAPDREPSIVHLVSGVKLSTLAIVLSKISSKRSSATDELRASLSAKASSSGTKPTSSSRISAMAGAHLSSSLFRAFRYSSGSRSDCGSFSSTSTLGASEGFRTSADRYPLPGYPGRRGCSGPVPASFCFRMF